MPGEQVGAAYAKIGLDQKDLDSGMASAKSKFSSFASGLESTATGAASKIGSAMKTALMAGGAAAAGAATAGLSTFKDLETAASGAAAKSVDVNGKSVEQIKAQYDSLQQHVMSVSRELGSSTVFDPTEVAQAYDALAGAGQNVAKIGKQELLPFLNLAAQDMEFGLGRTTELLGATMNTFGYTMQDSAKVGDMLTKAVAGTSLSLQDLDYGLRQGGAAAAGSGMKLEDFTAIVGKLKDKGITSAMAGDALKTAIQSLATPTKAAVETLAKYGLTVDDVNPRTKSFVEILKTLKDAGVDAIDMGSIFTDSSGAVMAAASGQVEEIIKLSKSITDSGGLSQTMADLVMDSGKLVGAWESAKGATSELFTAIGAYLEPAAVKLLNTWSALVPKIIEFGDAISKGNWSKAGELLSQGWDAAKNAFSGLYTFIESKINSIDWSAVGTKAGQLISSGIQSGIQTLQTIGQKIAGWIETQGGWSGLGTKIATAITSSWQSFKKWASPIIDDLKTSFQKWAGGSEPSEWGSKLGKGLVDGIKSILVISEGKSFLSTMVDWAKAGLEAGGKFLVGFLDGIGGLFDGIGIELNRAFATAFQKMADWIPDDYGLGGLKQKFQESADAASMYVERDGNIPGYGSYRGPQSQPSISPGNSELLYEVRQAGKEFYYLVNKATGEHVKTQAGFDFSYKTYSQALAAATERSEMASQKAAEETTNAAEIAAQTTTEAATVVAEKNKLTSDEIKSSLGDVIADGHNLAQELLESSLEVGSSLKEGAASVQNSMSQAAQTAIAMGNQVAASFKSGGDAVKIGLDASGKQIAIIGQVAQQNAAKGGTQFLTAIQSSQGIVKSITSEFSRSGQGVNSGLNSGANALRNAAGAVNSAASSLGSIGASIIGGAGGYGGNSGSNKGRSGDFFSSLGFDDLSGWGSGYHPVPTYADGTETTGPQMAVIGEDGKEFVIPTKKKRWDLLLAAMRAYGIKGMAEGGEGGSGGGAGTTDPENMQAYFGIRGLASMSKQVQKIINDLKDFFRISWSIIKSESAVYWKDINKTLTDEATSIRDSSWQSAIDIRNVWISGNRQIRDDAISSYGLLAEGIKEPVGKTRDVIIQAFAGAGDAVVSLMMQMGHNAIMAMDTFSQDFTTVWNDLLATIGNVSSQVASMVGGIAAKVNKIDVTVNQNSYGGGYGGGGGGGGSDMFSGGYGGGSSDIGGDLTINPDGTANFSTITCLGDMTLVNALKYTNPYGQTSYINPLNYHEGGGIAPYQGYSGGYGGYSGGYGGGGGWGSNSYSPGYSSGMSNMNSFGYGFGYGGGWAASGAKVDTPKRILVADKGPELVLPAKFTAMFNDMADNWKQGGSTTIAGQRIMLEDHTRHDIYIDGKKLSDVLMTNVVSRMQIRGAKAVR